MIKTPGYRGGTGCYPGGQSGQVLLQFLFLAAMMFVKTNALEWIMLQEIFPADDVFLLKPMF